MCSAQVDCGYGKAIRAWQFQKSQTKAQCCKVASDSCDQITVETPTDVQSSSASLFALLHLDVACDLPQYVMQGFRFIATPRLTCLFAISSLSGGASGRLIGPLKGLIKHM